MKAIRSWRCSMFAHPLILPRYSLRGRRKLWQFQNWMKKLAIKFGPPDMSKAELLQTRNTMWNRFDTHTETVQYWVLKEWFLNRYMLNWEHKMICPVHQLRFYRAELSNSLSHLLGHWYYLKPLHSGVYYNAELTRRIMISAIKRKLLKIFDHSHMHCQGSL